MTADNALDRRSLLRLAAAGAATFVTAAHADEAMPDTVKAIAFDGFVIFDPRPVFVPCESLFPGQGAALGELWRTRQFEYCWLRTLTSRYADFWTITEESLRYAAAQLKLD